MKSGPLAYSNTLSGSVDQIKNLTEYLKEISSDGLVGKLVATVLLVLIVLFFRWLGAKGIERIEHLSNQNRRRWLIYLRNITLLLIMMGLIGIWAEALRLVAYSLFAIAVATVIAVKDLIQCLSGGLLKSTSRSFTLGDRIEIAGIRGDVIDHTVMTTTIMEVGPDDLTQQLTGRATVIPNSLFLSKAVTNETFTHEFVLHVFKVPIKFNETWSQAEEDLLKAAREECIPYMEDARMHFEKLCKKEGLVSIGVEPRVTVRVSKPEEGELVVRVAVPARKKGRVEQAILRRYLAKVISRKAEPKPETKPPEEDQNTK